MFPKLKTLYGNKIIVEKYDKTKKVKNDGGPFSASRFADVLDTNDNLGVVVASQLSEVGVGAKIYFGNNFERVFIKGTEYFVMELANLIAEIDED